ncbi:MAG TPA: GNAT family N-acetyltransferase [Phycisphaerae bacterium]|nr:GNAT family N-acetyltransferase [Phycisphaerae bacterium]
MANIYRFVGEALARQEKRFQEGVRLAAFIDGQMVATMQYRLDARHVHLIGLAVLPEYQRRGIGRRLVEQVAILAPTLGHDTLALDTIAETGNVLIFKKWGFTVSRSEPATDCVSDRYVALHVVNMECKLSIG